MKKYFITFGDGHFEATRNRLCGEAEATGVFDVVKGYGTEDLSEELCKSETYSCRIKGGYWSWKPDVIWTTMNQMEDGDILFYVDAGSTVVPSREWGKYFRFLEKHEIVAQRIFLPTYAWTRRSLIDAFSENGVVWRYCRQFTSNVVILRKSSFTNKFVDAWRHGMINHPEWVVDVPKEDVPREYPGFIQNRYDQAVYSALVYQALKKSDTRDKVLAKWEHVEDIDPVRPQAIRITRRRMNQDLALTTRIKLCLKRFIKDWIIKTFKYRYQERRMLKKL